MLEKAAQLLRDLLGWIVGSSLLPSGEFDVLAWAARPALLIIGVVIGLELLMPRERRGWNKQHWLTFTHFVMSSKVAFFTFVTLPAVQWLWIRFSLPSLHLDNELHPLAFMALSLIVISFVDYWSHRLLHRIPLFWHIHKIHHAPTQLTWASTFQEHFAMSITAAPMLAVVTMLLGVHLVPPWGSVYLLVNYLQHANVSVRFGWLNYIFALPEVHRYHHSRNPADYDTNFGGGLVFWDMIFRTYKYDPDRPATEFGLDDPVPATWWRQQIAPLVWIWHDIRRSIRVLIRRPQSTPTGSATDSPAPSSLAMRDTP